MCTIIGRWQVGQSEIVAVGTVGKRDPLATVSKPSQGLQAGLLPISQTCNSHRQETGALAPVVTIIAVVAADVRRTERDR